MTPKMAAIFGIDSGDVNAPAVADPPDDDPLPDPADDPCDVDTWYPGAIDPAELGPQGGRAPGVIVEGAEHFSLWVDDAEGYWPEFIPGYHHDLRQPSRLRGPLQPIEDKGQQR